MRAGIFINKLIGWCRVDDENLDVIDDTDISVGGLAYGKNFTFLRDDDHDTFNSVRTLGKGVQSECGWWDDDDDV